MMAEFRSLVEILLSLPELFFVFNFPPLMLWLKCVILKQRFPNFGIVEFGTFDFI